MGFTAVLSRATLIQTGPADRFGASDHLVEERPCLATRLQSRICFYPCPLHGVHSRTFGA